MKPVEQRESHDCLIACTASILEIPYEDVPRELGQEQGQTRAFLNFMRSRGWAIFDHSLYGARGLPDKPRPRTPRTWPTWWFGSVLSPRLCDDDGEPGWHVVVMHGSDLEWDPHPWRGMGHLGFVHAWVPMPIDPARFVLRTAA